MMIICGEMVVYRSQSWRNVAFPFDTTRCRYRNIWVRMPPRSEICFCFLENSG